LKNKEITYRNPNQFTKIINETDLLKLEHEFESTFLVNKVNHQVLMVDDFYGEPVCGLIDTENNWAVVAGAHLTLWKPDLEIKYQTKEFKNIHSIRLKNNKTIEILTDPWDKVSAIWELDLQTNELIKGVNFNKYIGKKYVEQIEW